MATTAVNNPQKQIELEERRQRVLRAKRAGATERQIAAQEGVSLRTIQVDLDHVLTRMARRTDNHAAHWRALTMDRLEDQLRKINNRMLPYNPADPNDVPGRKVLPFDEGFKMIIAVLDREIRIQGIEAPTKIDITEANQLVALIVSLGGDPQKLFKTIAEMLTTPGQSLGLLAANAEPDDEDADIVEAEILDD